MDLSDEQKQVVSEWIRGGAGLSEVQTRLKDELDMSMTYMDVRFLVIDLDVPLQEPEPPVKPEPEPAEEAVQELQDELDAVDPQVETQPLPMEDADGIVANVTVEVDKLMRPGALVSGSVVFSDGVSSIWLVDQAGRFGLEPSQEGYKPSEADLGQLQLKLQEALARMGY